METADLEPQDDADVSLEDQLANDGSVDTAAADEPTEVETEVNELVEKPENEADPSPADEENVDERIDPTKDSENVKQRIDKLTENYRGEQRAGAEKDLRIAELEKQLADAPKETEPLKTLDDFEFDQGKYFEYLATRAEQRAVDAAEKVAKDYQAQARTESRQDAFKAREAEFSKTVDDYQEKVYGEVDGQRTWRASDTMAREITLSEMGEQVAYHLACNPDIAAEISVLSERETVRRIALLESTLITEKAKAKPNKVSKAPPPPPKLEAGEAGIRSGFHEDMTDKAFDALRRKQIANR